MTTAPATSIIEQLKSNHAANNAAGLGSPELDAFHDLLVELVAEAPDPKFRIREIADLITRGRGKNTEARP